MYNILENFKNGNSIFVIYFWKSHINSEQFLNKNIFVKAFAWQKCVIVK